MRSPLSRSCGLKPELLGAQFDNAFVFGLVDWGYAQSGYADEGHALENGIAFDLFERDRLFQRFVGREIDRGPFAFVGFGGFVWIRFADDFGEADNLFV